MGEVHTGLLQHSAAISADFALRLLAHTPGVRVRRADRPIAYTVSPDIVTGVDCELPSTGARVRGVGTTVSRVVITGGHALQGSTFVELHPGSAGRRQPWAHYLARPGVVELLSKADGEYLAAGFLSGTAGAAGGEQLDLGAIGLRAMDAVQSSELLDHRTVLKSSRTRLRWVIGPATEPQSISFIVHGDRLRTVQLRAEHHDTAAIAALCEDFALHDWLLTTLLSHVGRARIGTVPRATVVERLQPTIDYLLHLWMPAARVDTTLVDLWHSLDRQPGLTRQWHATVDRVRDQLALATVERLTSAHN